MISHQFQCVFVHIPKTAGQSIEQFFLEHHGLTWKQKDHLLMSKNCDPARGPSRLAHLRADEYYQCGHMDKSTFDKYYKFAFVRNPWQRLVSEYLHKKIDRHYSLKQFVMQGLPEANDFCDKYRHIIPQSDYIFDREGRCMVDFVGRFENLQSDFAKVCQRLEIDNNNLPHANSSFSPRRKFLRVMRHLFSGNDRIKKHYTEYYDEELKDLVATLYAKDIEHFGYQFESVKPVYSDPQPQLLPTR